MEAIIRIRYLRRTNLNRLYYSTTYVITIPSHHLSHPLSFRKFQPQERSSFSSLVFPGLSPTRYYQMIASLRERPLRPEIRTTTVPSISMTATALTTITTETRVVEFMEKANDLTSVIILNKHPKATSSSNFCEEGDTCTLQTVATDDMTLTIDSLSSIATNDSHVISHLVESELGDESSSEEYVHEEDVASDSLIDCNELDDSATIPTSHQIKCQVVVQEVIPMPPVLISKRATSAPISILKVQTKSEPRYINNSRRSWKSLPEADLDKILQQSKALDALARSLDGNDVRSPPPARNRVSFDSVRIRFYSQTVGDNPSVSYGPPISLDWDYVEQEDVAIDDYESNRPKRRNLRQMVLSYYHRKNLLSWQYGISEAELKQAKKQADRIKMKRSITKTFLPVMTFESALESAGRRAKQLVRSK